MQLSEEERAKGTQKAHALAFVYDGLCRDDLDERAKRKGAKLDLKRAWLSYVSGTSRSPSRA